MYGVRRLVRWMLGKLRRGWTRDRNVSSGVDGFLFALLYWYPRCCLLLLFLKELVSEEEIMGGRGTEQVVNMVSSKVLVSFIPHIPSTSGNRLTPSPKDPSNCWVEGAHTRMTVHGHIVR